MQTLRERDPDLTIIIPVYNLEKFIVPMLESLKQQDTGIYKIQTIFVLNNCTDNTEQVIRQYELDCEIINCDIQGCGPARNAGMEIATGEFIWFMDGDDWLLSDTAIRDVLDKVKHESLDILRVPFLSDGFRYNYFSMVWQYVFRRGYINEFRFPNYQPSEDDAFMKEVLNKAGYNTQNYIFLPRMDRKLYYYNYLREGSNMYRVFFGEEI